MSTAAVLLSSPLQVRLKHASTCRPTCTRGIHVSSTLNWKMNCGFSNTPFQLQCTSLRQCGTPDIGVLIAPTAHYQIPVLATHFQALGSTAHVLHPPTHTEDTWWSDRSEEHHPQSVISTDLYIASYFIFIFIDFIICTATPPVT